MAKSTRKQVKYAAESGAQTVTSVAGEALGAAAATAAGVVLERVAQGFGSGAKKVEKSAPAMKSAAKKAVTKRVSMKKAPARKKAKTAKQAKTRKKR
jgi:hypothetical protein